MDHSAKMANGQIAFFVVRREGVGIIAEGADRDFGVGHDAAGFVGLGGGEVGDVDVRDAGVTAFGLADGPTHDLDAIVAAISSEAGDIGEGQFGEDGGDEAELHGGNAEF